MKITLAEAFMLRNDLKKEITELTEQSTKNLWEEKDLPIDFTNGTKMNPSKAIEECLAKMEKLQLLGEAISAANIANNKLLRENETITAKIMFLEMVYDLLKSYPGDKIRNRFYNKDDESSQQFLENKMLVDAKGIDNQITEMKLRKRAIEKELAHNNFTITLEV